MERDDRLYNEQFAKSIHLGRVITELDEYVIENDFKCNAYEIGVDMLGQSICIYVDEESLNSLHTCYDGLLNELSAYEREYGIPEDS